MTINWLRGINIIQKQTGMHPSNLPWNHEWVPIYWRLQNPTYGDLPLEIERAQYHIQSQATMKFFEIFAAELNQLVMALPDWRQKEPCMEVLRIIANPVWQICDVDTTKPYQSWPILCEMCCFLGHKHCSHNYANSFQRFKIEEQDFKQRINKTFLDQKLQRHWLLVDKQFHDSQTSKAQLDNQCDTHAVAIIHDTEKPKIIDLTNDDGEEPDWTAPVLQPQIEIAYEGCYGKIPITYKGCYGEIPLHQSVLADYRILPFGTAAKETAFKNSVATQTTEREKQLAIEYPDDESLATQKPSIENQDYADLFKV